MLQRASWDSSTALLHSGGIVKVGLDHRSPIVAPPMLSRLCWQAKAVQVRPDQAGSSQLYAQSCSSAALTHAKFLSPNDTATELRPISRCVQR
jgi:hypothetical protein